MLRQDRESNCSVALTRAPEEKKETRKNHRKPEKDCGESERRGGLEDIGGGADKGGKQMEVEAYNITRFAKHPFENLPVTRILCVLTDKLLLSATSKFPKNHMSEESVNLHTLQTSLRTRRCAVK